MLKQDINLSKGVENEKMLVNLVLENELNTLKAQMKLDS